jgi:hypothetical protein
MGRIVEILQKIDSAEGIVVLEQYVLQPDRHELFNMPVLCPKRREEAVFLILNPKANYSLLIVALFAILTSIIGYQIWLQRPTRLFVWLM